MVLKEEKKDVQPFVLRDSNFQDRTLQDERKNMKTSCKFSLEYSSKEN